MKDFKLSRLFSDFFSIQSVSFFSLLVLSYGHCFTGEFGLFAVSFPFSRYLTKTKTTFKNNASPVFA